MIAARTIAVVARMYGTRRTILIDATRHDADRVTGHVRRGDDRIDAVDLSSGSTARQALPPVDRARILGLAIGETWAATVVHPLRQLYGPAEVA